MPNQPVPELPALLTNLGAVLRESDPEEMGEQGGALPWAVWGADDDPNQDILGAGDTPEEAIEDALATVAGWDIFRSLEGGR